ncbi:hypothetical protein LSH36_531g01063 [Paralvinella palmiformis]|uniref:Uncharacterized protein n=1 Tax=Paralvinella palmiformis TaxID=53620 RepID=A0AAD9J8K0_9ANNE|nr:hypothetical protein LSH36_531g01063 [Paralvinella palmiformis]
MCENIEDRFKYFKPRRFNRFIKDVPLTCHDRAVRDSERKAALMHFTTDQATVDQDDAVLLDYAGKTTAELLAPRKITGSANTKPHMEEYPPQVARQMDRAHVEGTHQMGLVAPISLPFPQIDSSSQDVHPSRATGDSVSGQQTANKTADGRSPTEPGSILLPQVAEDLQKNPSANTDDENLNYQDEVEAYTSYKAQGHFTPHPDLATNEVHLRASLGNEDQRHTSHGDEKVTSHYESPVISASAELYPAQNKQIERPPSQVEFTPPGDSEVGVECQSSDEPPSGPFGRFLTQISTLADKYWNDLLMTIYQEHTSGVQTPYNVPNVAAEELARLKQKLQETQEENRRLRERSLAMMEGTIERDNERLRNELISLNIRLKQASQMQELAAMLQESHKSLVQTNDHLLRELEETRQRHAAEVKQLHWSYDQLKKHVSLSSQYGQGKTHNGAT